MHPRSALPLAVATLLAGCGSSSSDGGASLNIRNQAVTSPISLFNAPASPLPAPPGGFGAEGPRGLALVGADDGTDRAGALEDSDLLAADPAGGRVLLYKARVRGGAAEVRPFNAEPLDEPRAIALASGRRAIVALRGGFAVLDDAGARLLPIQTVRAGVRYAAIALAAGEGALFLAGESGVDRVPLAAGTLAAAGPATALYSDAPARGVALRRSGDLFFTSGRDVWMIRGGAMAPAGAAKEKLFAFALCCTPEHVHANSAGNAVVAVAVAAGGPHVHRLEEVSASAPGTIVSTIHLPEPPAGVAIDVMHGSLSWSGATQIVQHLEAGPPLEARVFPIITARDCASCHFPGTTVEPRDLDLSTPQATHDTMFRVPVSCQDGTSAPLRVNDLNAAGSALVQKLEGDCCGAPMLEGTRPLPRIEIDTIRKWIDAGAFLHGTTHGGHGTVHH